MSYSDDSNDSDYIRKSSSSESSSAVDVGNDGGTWEELNQETLVGKDVSKESGMNDDNGGDIKDQEVVGKGSTDGIVQNNMEENYISSGSRGAENGGNGDGNDGSSDALEGSVDSNENVLSDESIFGPKFDKARCKESFLAKVNVVVKPSDNNNSAVWTDLRCLTVYHAFIALESIWELEEGKIFKSDYLLSSTQKTSNGKINARVKKFKNQTFFGGVVYNKLMKAHWLPKYRLIRNENVVDVDNIMDKYHLYKVKRELGPKYQKHYEKPSMQDMAGRIYCIDQMFDVLMDEFVQMNGTVGVNNERVWSKSIEFQDHMSQNYPNITKQIAKLFHESLAYGHPVEDDINNLAFENVGNDEKTESKNTKGEVHEDENVLRKCIADYYLTGGIFYKKAESGIIENKYIYMCDINTLKSSAAWVDSLDLETILFTITEIIVRDFDGYGGTVVIEDDGQVFVESKHVLQPQTEDEKNYACKVYQRHSQSDVQSDYIPQINVDGSKSSSVVS